ncbi:hypothetical protein [Micromonospora sp. DT229]|uniref:hypothetical protein n=1 Tax=Micromonospora sp. DT229 TaxID=3393430 RepID=UPI003CE6B5D5
MTTEQIRPDALAATDRDRYAAILHATAETLGIHVPSELAAAPTLPPAPPSDLDAVPAAAADWIARAGRLDRMCTDLQRALDGLRNDHRSALRANRELTAVNAGLRQQRGDHLDALSVIRDSLERIDRAMAGLDTGGTAQTTTLPTGWHITRGTGPSDLENGCPCPKAACGAVDTEHTNPTCDQHPPSKARTMRHMHRADQCPATAPVPPAPAQEIRPADWEQQAIDAVQAALADAWGHLTEDPVHTEQIAITAVRAVIDAGLAGAGGRCRQCGQTFPRTLPADQDPLCWTCETEQQDGLPEVLAVASSVELTLDGARPDGGGAMRWTPPKPTAEQTEG